MTRVTISIQTSDGSEVEVVEASRHRAWGSVETLLDRALVKIRAAYKITDPITPQEVDSGVTLSDTNRALLYRAYDDGTGNTLSVTPSETPGYFEGIYDGDSVMKGTEVNGILYSICFNYPGPLVSVLIGDEIISGGGGISFQHESAAQDHIERLASQ